MLGSLSAHRYSIFSLRPLLKIEYRCARAGRENGGHKHAPARGQEGGRAPGRERTGKCAQEHVLPSRGPGPMPRCWRMPFAFPGVCRSASSSCSHPRSQLGTSNQHMLEPTPQFSSNIFQSGKYQITYALENPTVWKWRSGKKNGKDERNENGKV